MWSVCTRSIEHRVFCEVNLHPCRQGAQQVSAFSLYLWLLGHCSLCIFFLIPTPACHMVERPQCCKPSSPLPHSDGIPQPLGHGEAACTKALELLALGFLLRSWTASNTSYFGLQFKLWIFLLFLFFVCFTVNTYMCLPFTNLQKVQFPVWV